MDPELTRARFDRDVRPLLVNPTTYQQAGLRLIEASYPHLVVSLAWRTRGCEILLKVDATDWDYLPPKGWWISEDGAVLVAGQQRVPNGYGFQIGSNVYGEIQCWFCFPGWREYHNHPGHLQPPWAYYRRRTGYRLMGIVAQLQADLNKPEVMPG